MSSEDEEDAVEENCKSEVDSIYNIDDINELDESNTDHSTTKESTDEDANSYKARNFRWSKESTRVGRTRIENIIVRLPGC